MKDFPKTALQPLQSVFIYLLTKQLDANSLDTTTVIPYSALQGYVTLDCASSYDEIRVEQIVNTVARQINLFDTENGNFEEYTDSEKAKLNNLLTKRNSDSKKHVYYKAIKELIKQKIYPPYSMQRTLIQEAEEFAKADDFDETTDIVEIKQGDLQMNSWLWTRVVNVFPNNPLRKEAVYLASELSAVGIKGIEELSLLTANTFKRMFFVGTPDCHRLAIKSEVENMNNLRNVISKRIDIYKTQTDKFLTVACAALFTRSIPSVKAMYDILNDVNCNIDYDLRFSDLSILAEITDYRVSSNLAEGKWAQYVVANRNIVANILTAIGLRVKQLYPLWKVSTEDVDYPEDFDELQVYYEGQGLDIDTLSVLMSIDAEEGDTKHMLLVIRKNGVRHPSDKLPYDIAVQALKRKQITLSDKQYAIIEKRYNSIMKTTEMSKTIDAAECMKVAQELERRFKGQLNKTVENIVNSTLRYGICTERQLEVMRMAYVSLTAEAEKETSKSAGKGIQIGDGGLMFNLPSTPVQNAPQAPTEPKPEEDVEFTQQVKTNMTTDAYRNAFGDTSHSDSSNNDSIWDD